MTSRFYLNQQVREFIEWGYIQFSNPDCLSEYETELQGRKLEYRVVRGLGDYGLTIVICKPEKFQEFTSRLSHEIERAKKILAIKESAHPLTGGAEKG